MKIPAFKYVRTHANAYTYGPNEPEHKGRIWVQVIRGGWEKVDGRMVPERLPTFRFNIYKEGFGQISEFTYKPKSKPKPGALPGRTVTRLVRENVK